MDIKLLEEKYLEAKEAYYNGEPIMEDWEFDELEQILRDNFSEVINIVGSTDKSLKVEHWNKMLSLSKISASINGDIPTEEFSKWVNSKISILDKKHYHLMALPKYDGNSCNLQYINGKLHKAITRGNGDKGKDITSKAKYFVPLTINCTENVEIRGEAIFDTASYEKWKTPEIKNARNYVGGILNRDEENPELLSDIKFIAFNVQYKDSLNRFEDNEDLFLDYNGFNKVHKIPHYIVTDEKSFLHAYECILSKREDINYGYGLDGFVLKFNLAEERNILGENSHDPEWSLAVKFPPKETSSEIIGIEWNISFLGEMIPVILIKPTDLDGSTIRRVSGYNAGYIVNNKIEKGKKIKLVKSGDIIPMISGFIN